MAEGLDTLLTVERKRLDKMRSSQWMPSRVHLPIGMFPPSAEFFTRGAQYRNHVHSRRLDSGLVSRARDGICFTPNAAEFFQWCGLTEEQEILSVGRSKEGMAHAHVE